MAEMTGSLLLPEWLRAALVILLAAVAVLHLWHVISMTGQRRWWHAGHTVMAFGMVLMYLLPRLSHVLLYRVGLAVFAVLAVLSAVMTAWFASREHVLNPLWAVTTVDMVAMAYMFGPMSARIPLLSYVLAGYLVCQVIAWALGLWTRVPVLSRSQLALADDGGGVRTEAVSGPSEPIVSLTAQSSPAVLTSLSIMAAAMASMLMVM